MQASLQLSFSDQWTAKTIELDLFHTGDFM